MHKMTVDVVLRRIFHIFSVNPLQTWLVVYDAAVPQARNFAF